MRLLVALIAAYAWGFHRGYRHAAAILPAPVPDDIDWLGDFHEAVDPGPIKVFRIKVGELRTTTERVN